MGVLFDAVRIKAGKGALFLNGEKIAEIPPGGITITVADESTPTITEEQYAYFRGRRNRPGVYMREEPVRPARKEQSDYESQDQRHSG